MSKRKFAGLSSLLTRGRAVMRTGDAAVASAPQSAAARSFSLTAGNIPAPWVPPPKPEPQAIGSGRLVFAVDATGSRAAAWDAAKGLTDTLLSALPGELEVALAVHGGGRVHTFTPFVSDAGELRDLAAGVRCQAGNTRLVEILERVARMDDDVGVVLYIGDAFEESETVARRVADALNTRETRVIILHDGPPLAVFGDIADRTGGALLPFDMSALEALGELLEAVAVLAVGDIELLEAKQAMMPAATLLLEHLSGRKS